MAVRARADPTRDPDGLIGARLGQVQPVGIDQPARMRDLDPQPDGKSADRRVEGARMLRDVACQQQVTDPVRRLCQLAQEAARLLERLMDVPQLGRHRQSGRIAGGSLNGAW